MSNAIIRHVKALSLSLQPSYMCTCYTYTKKMFLELKKEGGMNRQREEQRDEQTEGKTDRGMNRQREAQIEG